MNILNKLTIKHLKLNKRRTIVSVIGILLSTALMVGIGLICSSIREYSIDETKASYGSYHVLIEDVPANKLETLKRTANIKSLNYESLLGYSSYLESDNEAKPYFKVKAVNKNFFTELKLITGRFPTNSTEIVISTHLFNYSDVKYKVGDTITFDLGQRYLENSKLGNHEKYTEGEYLKNQITQSFTIVGIIERPNYNYEEYSDPGFSVYTVIDNKIDLQNINTYLEYKDLDNVYSYSETLYKSLGKGNTSDFYNDLSYNDLLLSLYGQSRYDNFNKFIVSFMSLFLSILSVACIIVIYNSFAISVMERKKQFGLFSSIGTTRKQIRKTVFFEALIVGSIGMILGVLSAYLGIGTVILVLNNLLSNVLNYPLKLVTYPLFIIIPLIFMVLVIIISAFLPAFKASKVSPIEAIRQNDDIKIKKNKIKTPQFIRKVFGIEGDIALKNMRRNKNKYRITVVSLFISIVTFISFSTYLEIGQSTAGDFIGTYDYDIVASFYNNNADLDIINRLIKNEQTDKYTVAHIIRRAIKVDPSVYTKEYLQNHHYLKKDLIEWVPIVLLDDASYQEYKKELHLKEDKPIVNNALEYFGYDNDSRVLKQMNIYKKDKLSFNFCDISSSYHFDDDGSYTNDEITKELLENNCNYPLNNIYLTDKRPFGLDNGSYIIVNEKIFNEINDYTKTLPLPYSDSTDVYIKAKKYDKLNKIGAEMDNHNDMSYYNITESMQTEKNILLAISILLYGFITLVTLIGVTSVFNTISTSIMLRKKEFSVLRSIGLTPRGFNKMIYFESLFFALKALFFGIPLGIFISYLISRNMNMLVANNFFFPLKAIIISIISCLVITLWTMLYSTSKIKKENILDAIREENI